MQNQKSTFRWLVLGLLFLNILLGIIGKDCIPPLFSEIEKQISLTKAQMRIFYEFMLKRRFGQLPKKGRKQQGNIIVNNGHITFTYAEAEKLGYPRSTFNRAIDKLIEVGLIDLTYQGQGGHVGKDGKITGERSLYAISERWMDYGTDRFNKRKRRKDTRKGRGWSVYHERNSKRKNKSK